MRMAAVVCSGMQFEGEALRHAVLAVSRVALYVVVVADGDLELQFPSPYCYTFIFRPTIFRGLEMRLQKLSLADQTAFMVWFVKPVFCTLATSTSTAVW